MPYTADTLPDAVKALPDGGRKIWLRAFNSTFKTYDGADSEKEVVAAKVAWSAVKKEYREVDGEWQAIAKSTVIPVRYLRVGGDDRIVVEIGAGLGDFTGVQKRHADDAGIVVFQKSGAPVAISFPPGDGWTPERAVAQAKFWCREADLNLKRVGVARNLADDGGMPKTRIILHPLRKSVADAALAKHRIAFGEVWVPYEMDTQGSITTPEHIQKAAYGFMAKPTVGIMHAEWGNIGNVVENFIVRDGDPDFEVPGTWVQGIQFGERAWQGILNDELTGLSIGGTARSVPIEMEAAA